jgi:lysozyme family protein
MRSSRFYHSVQFVLDHEGGLSKDPKDPGGTTNFGISQRAFPNVDVENISIDVAIGLYYDYYWMPLKCDYFGNGCATVLLDTAVNCGAHRASKWLQTTINLKAYTQIKVDGSIGSQTIDAAHFLAPGTLASGIIANRLEHYAKIDPDNRYIDGWVRRVSELIFYVL